MAYHVHIYNVGQKAETAFNVLTSGIEMHKLYLLNNENPNYVAVEKEIREFYRKVPIDGVVTKLIDPFDYDSVYNMVLEIDLIERELHQDVKFHINFTMGTSIMVGAVCSAAYAIDADLYYIQESCYSKSGKDELILIEIGNTKEVFELRKKKQTLEVFRMFIDMEPKSNRELMGNRSASSLSYHTKSLSSMGLIEREGGVRDTVWVLTPKGRGVLKRV